jgi:hypothetical protein
LIRVPNQAVIPSHIATFPFIFSPSAAFYPQHESKKLKANLLNLFVSRLNCGVNVEGAKKASIREPKVTMHVLINPIWKLAQN